jgi:hypothetical protein
LFEVDDAQAAHDELIAAGIEVSTAPRRPFGDRCGWGER